MDTDPSLIAELEDAIKSGSQDKRVETLRRITDLFVAGADRFHDRQIKVFDEVLGRLIKYIEARALAELSRRLGPIGNAPLGVVGRLARHDDIAVAEPILTQSVRLTDCDLIEIANTKTQAHLLAISGRSQIAPPVTEVLLQRGDTDVVHKLAENSGARFTDRGFENLVELSGRDEHLAEKVGLRRDIPSHLFQALLSRATETVRARLLAVADPESRDRIQRVLTAVCQDAQSKVRFQSDEDCVAAYARALAMRQKGELSEAALLATAKNDRGPEMIAMLSLLCEAPMSLVRTLLHNDHRAAFLMPCKAAGLSWATVRVLLASPAFDQKIPERDFEVIRADYAKLTQSSAQRVLRFWQIRQTAAKDAAARVSPLEAKLRAAAGR